MSEVHVSGRLVCESEAEAARVTQHLPGHIELTRAEPGCLSFEVTATDEDGVWNVDERFVDAAAFYAHQQRAAQSTWGQSTVGITREYTVTGLDG